MSLHSERVKEMRESTVLCIKIDVSKNSFVAGELGYGYAVLANISSSPIVIHREVSDGLWTNVGFEIEDASESKDNSRLQLTPAPI